MKMTVLVDNIASDGLPGEWGLSIYIEHGGLRWLLDAGQSDLFLRNARAIGIDLALVDHAVLSHAHYDHADGLASFLAVNGRAGLFVAAGAGEACWKRKDGQWKYIGIARGLLAKAGPRLRRVDGLTQVETDAWLLPHASAGLELAGLAEQMYLRDGDDVRPDDFSHEQSLIFGTPQGLVVCSSCSHAGADLILREVEDALPGRPVLAMVGGFHLYNKTGEQVRAFAGRLRDTGVKTVCTGHCTGESAFGILREVLGARAVQFRTGLVLEF